MIAAAEKKTNCNRNRSRRLHINLNKTMNVQKLMFNWMLKKAHRKENIQNTIENCLQRHTNITGLKIKKKWQAINLKRSIVNNTRFSFNFLLALSIFFTFDFVFFSLSLFLLFDASNGPMPLIFFFLYFSSIIQWLRFQFIFFFVYAITIPVAVGPVVKCNWCECLSIWV